MGTNTEGGSPEEGTAWREARRLPEEELGADLGEGTFRLRKVKGLEACGEARGSSEAGSF